MTSSPTHQSAQRGLPGGKDATAGERFVREEFRAGAHYVGERLVEGA